MLGQQRLLQQQQQRAETNHGPLLPTTSLSPEKTSAEKATATADTTRPVSRWMQAVTVKGCARPTKLPQRRRTHWDYLLQEMQWTATDFIEERKWKVASSKLVVYDIAAAAVKQKPAAAVATAVVVPNYSAPARKSPRSISTRDWCRSILT